MLLPPRLAARPLRLLSRLLLMSSFSSSASSSSPHKFVMDAFCMRQFDDDYTGTQLKFKPEDFEVAVNEAFESGKAPLVDGYAPFCKHLFIPNTFGVKCGYAEKTPEVVKHSRSGYEQRKEGELAVLVEWVDANDVPPPVATYLDVILYSREQITLENIAMGSEPPKTDAPWGIISVKGQLCDHELPMQPITMMRNALGAEEGGSGVPLQKEEYAKSVAFWRENISIK